MKYYELPQQKHWSDREDLLKIGKVISPDEKESHYAGTPLDWYPNEKKAVVLNSDQHVAIFGGTGAGKTKSIIYPTIVSALKNGENIFVNDTKEELARMFSGMAKEAGYNVIILNFRNPPEGNKFNPFDLPQRLYNSGHIAQSDMMIRDIAEVIYSELSTQTKDAFWTNASCDYFTGLAQLLREEAGHITLHEIAKCSAEGNNRMGAGSLLSQYMSSIDSTSDIYLNLNGTINAPNETKSSILSVFASPLSRYASGTIQTMLSASDFKIEDILSKKTALFVVTPPDRALYDAMVTLIVKQIFSAAVDIVAPANAGKLPVRLNMILDEFSSLPRLPDFSNKMICLSREYSIRFIICCQSLSQLSSKYGAEEAKTIMTNCSLWYVMRSKDFELHQHIVQLCGKRTSEYTGTVSELITTSEIQHFNRGQALIISEDIYPYIQQFPEFREYGFKFFSVPAASCDSVPFSRAKIEKYSQFDLKEIVRKKQLKKITPQNQGNGSQICPPWIQKILDEEASSKNKPKETKPNAERFDEIFAVFDELDDK